MHTVNPNNSFTFEMLALSIFHFRKTKTMKQLLFVPLLSLGISPVNKQVIDHSADRFTSRKMTSTEKTDKGFNICSQPSPENEKMLAVVFRKQDFCRAELKDFQFDVHFEVVSATVYFSGTNFRAVETGFINSNSLKPIRSLMDKCAPGTMVVFDNVKVIGPDKQLRSIQGTSYLLH